MKRLRNKIYISIVVVAAILLISGASMLASASPGTSSDPLVTLSYLDRVFRPRLITDATNAGRDAMSSEVNRLVTAVESAPTPPSGQIFVSVTINNGQSHAIPRGAEVMLRDGTARLTAGGQFINHAGGTALSAGDAAANNLVRNNMYLASADATITAVGGAATILVRGAGPGIAPSTLDLDLDVTDLSRFDARDLLEVVSLRELVELIDLEDLLEVVDLEDLLEEIDMSDLLEAVDLEDLLEEIDLRDLFEVIDLRHMLEVINLQELRVLLSNLDDGNACNDDCGECADCAASTTR